MSIQERQNTPESIRRLSAQRHLYSCAKRIRSVSILTIGAVAILGLIASAISNKQYAQYVSVVILLSWFFDQMFLATRERARRTEAATIQEAFDCFVLDLAWPHYKGIQPPTRDRVDQLAAAAQHATEELKDWYSTDVMSSNPMLTKIRCQTENFWWDADLRERWLSCVTWFFSALFASLIALAVYTGLTVAELVAIMISGIRVLAWGQSEYYSQTSAIKRLRKVHSFISDFCEDRLPSAADIRGVQDVAFEHRCSALPVPDWFYQRHRDTHEMQARWRYRT